MKKRAILKKMQQLDSLPLPEKEKILAACEAAVPESAPVSAARRAQFFIPRRAIALAMVALLLVCGGGTVAMGVTAMAKEAKEYNETLDFFEEYNLSAEGFTRSEIKKIYRDIVSESFTYEKTEAALASGLEGYEIQTKPLDSDGLKRLWLMGYVWKTSDGEQTGEEGVTYGYYYQMISTKDSVAIVTKWKDEKVAWQASLEDIAIYSMRPVGDKVLVAGYSTAEDSPQNKPLVRIYLLNADSSIAWQKDYDSQMPMPHPEYILVRDNNTCELFCRSFYCDSMWIMSIDMEGNLLGSRYATCDRYGGDIEKVIPVGNGYLMLKGDQLMQEKNGKVQEMATFENEKEKYQITDMVEYKGLVYLSGRIIPQYNGANKKDILDHYIERFGETRCTNEELTQFFRDQYTAVLLICNPNSGEPMQFYTVPGASGSSLEVKNNKLSWDVTRYTDAEHIGRTFEDARSCYQAGGGFGLIRADVWQYVFTPYGQVAGEKDTGKSVEFENYPY